MLGEQSVFKVENTFSFGVRVGEDIAQQYLVLTPWLCAQGTNYMQCQGSNQG